MKIYIAGSFATETDRMNLIRMIDLVRDHYSGFPYEIYIPMYFKVDGDFQNSDGSWHMKNSEWAQKVFDNDVKELESTDRVFVMYSGHHGTTGTPWEIGYAYAKNKTIIGYIPESDEEDVRDMSLMMLNSWSGYMTDQGTIYYKDKDRSVFENFLENFNQK